MAKACSTVRSCFPDVIISSLSDVPMDTKTVSVQAPAGSGQRGDGIAAGLGAEDVAEVGEERAPLEAAGERGGEQPLDRALALLGLAAERELAVDDRAAQSAFGVVVGRLDAVGVGEGPEGGPAVEEVLGEDAVIFRPGAFPGGVFEQRAQFRLQRRGAGLETGPVAVVVGVP